MGKLSDRGARNFVTHSVDRLMVNPNTAWPCDMAADNANRLVQSDTQNAQQVISISSEEGIDEKTPLSSMSNSHLGDDRSPFKTCFIYIPQHQINTNNSEILQASSGIPMSTNIEFSTDQAGSKANTATHSIPIPAPTVDSKKLVEENKLWNALKETEKNKQKKKKE